MNISKDGIRFIQQHEGCLLTAYRCPAGVWTIGYGHMSNVRQGMHITPDQAEAYLRQDLKVVETSLSAAVKCALTQNQYDALCSFIFNVGCGAFLRSTLLRKVKADPSDPTIADEFLKWNKSGGRVLAGLTKRRIDERNLYFGR